MSSPGRCRGAQTSEVFTCWLLLIYTRQEERVWCYAAWHSEHPTWAASSSMWRMCPTPPPHQGGSSLNIRSVLSSLWVLTPHACPGGLASEQCVASYFSFASRLPVFLEVISALLSEALWQPCAPLPTCIESQEPSPDSAETQHLGSANCKLGDETKLPGDQQSRVMWGCRKDGKEF